MFDYFLEALPDFLAYFGSVLGLAIVFLTIYMWATPHDELKLIREGNTAAALQLTGTFLGFALPVSIVIAHSVSIPDMLLWGAVAAVVQLIVFFIIARILFKAIAQRIEEGCNASGVFVGGMGAVIGVLQAACMIP